MVIFTCNTPFLFMIGKESMLYMVHEIKSQQISLKLKKKIALMRSTDAEDTPLNPNG